MRSAKCTPPPNATPLLKFHGNFRRNNGANEGNNSPLENYKVIFRRNNGANESNISSSLDYCRMQPIEDIVSTATPGGGLNLIIAEWSPLNT